MSVDLKTISTGLLVLSWAVCSACSSRAPEVQDDLSEKFRYVLHDSLQIKDVKHLRYALEQNYDRIKRNFELESLPLMTVQVWSDEMEFQAAMQREFGQSIPGSGGYVTGDREIRLLYQMDPSLGQKAVHEFTHAVSLHINPRFGNNPRWLWEAVALYEAGEFKDPTDYFNRANGVLPTIEELNSDFSSSKTIYDFGFLLGDYIVSNWSQGHLLELIQSEGNLRSVLHVDASEFESGWHAFIESKVEPSE